MSFFAALVFGTMTLTASSAESLGHFRVAPRATNTHEIRVVAKDHWITVDGTGSTDLDCWLYDASRQLVDSDTDATREDNQQLMNALGSAVKEYVEVRNGGHFLQFEKANTQLYQAVQTFLEPKK